jgi:hypothetical protein
MKREKFANSYVRKYVRKHRKYRGRRECLENSIPQHMTCGVLGYLRKVQLQCHFQSAEVCTLFKKTKPMFGSCHDKFKAKIMIKVITLFMLANQGCMHLLCTSIVQHFNLREHALQHYARKKRGFSPGSQLSLVAVAQSGSIKRD